MQVTLEGCDPLTCDDLPVIDDFGAFAGDTTGGPTEQDAQCADDPTGPEQGHVLSLDYDGTVCIDTFGSTFDTVLSVRPTCEQRLPEINCDDDTRDRWGQLEVEVTAGEDLFVLVDGDLPHHAGPYTLRVRPGACDACASDDDCASRICRGGACQPSVCGDGDRGGPEECDDSGVQPGDGCAADCTLEPRYTCGEPGDEICAYEQCAVDADCREVAVCDQGYCNPVVCGDGRLAGLEQCDDGNRLARDGCAPDCTLEEGAVCDPPAAPILLTGDPGLNCQRELFDFPGEGPVVPAGLYTAAYVDGAASLDGGATWTLRGLSVLAGFSPYRPFFTPVEPFPTADALRIASIGLRSDSPFEIREESRLGLWWDDRDCDDNRGEVTLAVQPVQRCTPGPECAVDADSGHPFAVCRGQRCLKGVSGGARTFASVDGRPVHDAPAGTSTDDWVLTPITLQSGPHDLVLSTRAEDGVAVAMEIYGPFTAEQVADDAALAGLNYGGNVVFSTADQIGGEWSDYQLLGPNEQTRFTACPADSVLTHCLGDAPLCRSTRVVSTCALREVLCGDGVLQDHEGCDDGNLEDGDGCSAQCVDLSVCGDGVTEVAEQCDDGNLDDGDGCSATCTFESACGDGVTEVAEQCDDGNLDDGDGCSATCTFEPCPAPIVVPLTVDVRQCVEGGEPFVPVYYYGGGQLDDRLAGYAA